MKKVRMLVDTAYKGPKKVGDEVNVPDDFAARWVKNKIAEVVEEVEPSDSKPEQTEVNYSDLTAKELFALCKEKGIEAEPKQAKEYYLNLLA